MVLLLETAPPAPPEDEALPPGPHQEDLHLETPPLTPPKDEAPPPEPQNALLKTPPPYHSESYLIQDLIQVRTYFLFLL